MADERPPDPDEVDVDLVHIHLPDDDPSKAATATPKAYREVWAGKGFIVREDDRAAYNGWAQRFGYDTVEPAPSEPVTATGTGVPAAPVTSTPFGSATSGATTTRPEA